MYVKTSWRTYNGKRYVYHHLVEAYRDPVTGQPRARTLLNLSQLPDHVIAAIKESLRTGESTPGSPVRVTTGDALRGAGTLAIYRSWKRASMDQVLAGFSDAERQLLFALVCQRILNPGSTFSLETGFRDTIFAKSFSHKRLDEEELYRVMSVLHDNFHEVQERLRARRQATPLLCLYDITGAYSEGTEAEDDYSQNGRHDRYQVVVGLVCDEQGVPLALEVWSGNRVGKTTVSDRVRVLKERYKIANAVFVSGSATYSEASIDSLIQCGIDYILNIDWQTQRKQLESLTQEQRSRFVELGVIEWESDGARYIGYCSEPIKELQARRREEGMEQARIELEKLALTAAKGGYYSWTRLQEKVNQILKHAGVKDLWHVEMNYLDNQTSSPETKARLQLTFRPNQEAIAQREQLEGKCVLRTSLPSDIASPQSIQCQYYSLAQAKRAFRHVKSYLQTRPVYCKTCRARSYVLICFLAFYLVKQMELELREQGITEVAQLLLNRWDLLRLVNIRMDYADRTHQEWQWSLGEIGSDIRQEITNAKLWRSLDAYRRSLELS